METNLIKYDSACRAIAECKSTDELLSIADLSDRMRAAAKIAKNKQAEIDMAEIRIRAETRLGEMIAEQKRTVGLNEGARAGGKKDSPRGSIVEPRDTRPTLADAGIDRKLSMRAQKLAAVPKPEYEQMIQAWRERVSDETARVTTNLIRAGEREQKASEKVDRPLPEGKYNLLYVDPPWRYEHSKTDSRKVENQYPTMSLEEICSLSVPAADDCILFLWATSPKLAEALRVVEDWGFTYRTCAVWDKGKIGMGYYFRQQHELLLIATRGHPGTPEPDRRPPSVFYEERGEHSAKPKSVYRLLEAMYPQYGPDSRRELFQREEEEGWPGWGNENI